MDKRYKHLNGEERGGHCPEWHQRVGAGIGGLRDTGPDSRAAKGGTRRSAIARESPRYVRFGHRQLVRRLVPGAFPDVGNVSVMAEDFVPKRAVFGDIFYGLKTLCRFKAHPPNVSANIR